MFLVEGLQERRAWLGLQFLFVFDYGYPRKVLTDAAEQLDEHRIRKSLTRKSLIKK